MFYTIGNRNNIFIEIVYVNLLNLLTYYIKCFETKINIHSKIKIKLNIRISIEEV